MSQARIKDHVNTWSLEFKDQALEASFIKERQEEFARMWPRGVVLLMVIIGLVNALIRLINNFNNELDNLVEAGMAGVITCVVSVVLEFLIHALRFFRHLRGLFLCSGAMLAGVIYGSYLHSTPVLQPASVVSFYLAIFGNLYFAYGWRLAVLNQFIGHAVMTIYLAIRYAPSLTATEVLIPLVNINALLLILPFFFYFAERDKRQIAFHASHVSQSHFFVSSLSIIH